MKRLLSLVLTISIIFSLCAVTAFADNSLLNVGYFAKVNVTNKDGLSASAGANGDCRWRLDPGYINDSFIHTETGYWGYLYSVATTELPVNVDFDFREKEAVVDTVKLIQGNRGADNSGRYTKIQLQYYNGTEWEDIPVQTSDAISVSGNVITLNWDTPTSNESYSALNMTASLDTIDIKLANPVAMADCRIKILEAVGSGAINGEFAIDEIKLMGGWASETDLADTAVAEMFAIKGVTYAEKFPTQANIDTAKSRVAALSSGDLKTKLEDRVNALSNWTNLALTATATAGIGSAEGVQNDVEFEQGWVCQTSAAADKKYIQFDYGKTVTIKKIDLVSWVMRGSVSSAEIYAINGDTEEKVAAFDSNLGMVPERQYFDFTTDFGTDALKTFEAADVSFLGDSITDRVRKAKTLEYYLPTSIVCDSLKFLVTSAEAPWGDFSVSELRTWGIEGVDQQYESINLAFNAHASAYLPDGTEIKGGVDAHPQRKAITAINDYDIDGLGGWYTYILPVDNLPGYVELDYDTDIAELNKFSITALETSYGLTKFQMEMFDGSEWKTVTPSNIQKGGVSTDGNTVILNWENPSRTETNSAGSRTQYFMDVNFAAPQIGLKFRIKILEAVGSGGHWGMLPVPEIMTYGWNPTYTDILSRTDSETIVAKLAEGLTAAAVKYPTAKNINAAKWAVSNISGGNKAELDAKLAKLNASWTNIALLATANAGEMTDYASKLNDDKYASADDGWKSQGTAISESSWVELDYGKNMKIGRINISAKYYPSSVTSVDVYAKINGEYTLIKSDADVSISHTPEISWYGSDKTPFENEAMTYLDSIGYVREDKLDYIFPSFATIELDSPVVCTAIKLQVKGAQSSWGNYTITELQTWGYEPSEDELTLTVGNYRMYSGTEVNEDNLITAPVAGSVTLACDIDNMSIQAQECTLIACVYKNNKLTAISINDLGELASESSFKDKSVTVNVPDAEGAQVRLLVWNGFGTSGLQPIAEGASY